ncbi:cobalamin-dependent protein [bacterium]|nr:cobalamin-dependent protein [bacterium]
MKIFFIQADQKGQAERVFPIGICYVATAAEAHGHKVEAFDPNVEKDAAASLEKRLKTFDPDLIGVSLRNIDSQHTRKLVFYLEFLRPQIDLIKRIAPGKRMVIGGSGFSIFAKDIMEMFPEFDYGVYLEAEETFPELLKNLNHPENVRGIFYRKGGRVFFTEKREMPDFGSLPSPKRDYFPVDRYMIHGKASMGVQAKRGCVLDCAYCTYPFLNGRTIRSRDHVKVVDEIQEIQDRWHFDKFMFVDSVFNIPLGHAEDICREMIRRGLHIKWFAYFNEKHISEDFIRLAYNAGCENFLFSPDGYSETTLKSLGKTVSVEDINNAFRIIRKVKGARIGVSFFRTPPGQDLWTFFRILMLYLRAKAALGKRLIGFGLVPIRIEPYTKILKIAISENACDKNTDLVRPVFYQYRPAMYIETVLSGLVRTRNIAQMIMGFGRKRPHEAAIHAEERSV